MLWKPFFSTLYDYVVRKESADNESDVKGKRWKETTIYTSSICEMKTNTNYT